MVIPRPVAVGGGVGADAADRGDSRGCSGATSRPSRNEPAANEKERLCILRAVVVSHGARTEGSGRGGVRAVGLNACHGFNHPPMTLETRNETPYQITRHGQIQRGTSNLPVG